MGLLIVTAATALLQPTNSSAQTLPIDRGAFPPVRFEEQYPSRAAAAERGLPIPALKAIQISQDITADFGGELRERFEVVENPLLGLGEDDSYGLSRFLLHANVKFGDHVRTFVQLGWHEDIGKQTLLPPDSGGVDLAQAFVDVSFSPAAGASGNIRLGRQEILLGSGRFIDVREGPNLRQSHDGVRLTYATDKVTVDAFLVRPVAVGAGDFDDRSDTTRAFGGVYATRRFGPGLQIDLWYAWLRREQVRYDQIAGTDNRHTIAARAAGRSGAIDYDVEVLAQFGSFGPAEIRAGGVALSIGYTADFVPLQPRFGMRANYFTGDKNADDGHLGTFSPLFPRGGYFNELAYETFSNIVDVSPNVTVNPTRRLAVSAAANVMWRQTQADAFYITPNVGVPGTAGVPGRYIGTSASLQASWQATPFVAVNASIVDLFIGGPLERTGFKDVRYAALWASFKF